MLHGALLARYNVHRDKPSHIPRLSRVRAAAPLPAKLLHEGPVAQLVERHVYTVDVVGSSPAGPTLLSAY